MKPNFQGLIQGQTRPRSRLVARPGLGYKKTGLICCFVGRLQVGILSLVAGIKFFTCIFRCDLPVRSVHCSTHAGRCVGEILIPIKK